METSSMLDLVDQLEENIEDLEDSLAPLLESGSSLASTTKKLPLVDRAKLDVLLVYAIESIIFSFLKLHGIDAKEHAVFRELSRVKPYFEKIKNAEAGASPSRPSAILNKEAANRVIRHALAGNAKYDLERAEREARDKFRANQKLKNLEASLQEKAKAQAQDEKPVDEKADALQLAAQLASLPQETSDEDSSSAENDKETAGAVDVGEASSIPKTKSENLTESSPPQEISQETPQEKRRGKKRKSQQAEHQQPSKKSKKEEKKAKKKDRQEKKAKKAQKKTAAGTEDGG